MSANNEFNNEVLLKMNNGNCVKINSDQPFIIDTNNKESAKKGNFINQSNIKKRKSSTNNLIMMKKKLQQIEKYINSNKPIKKEVYNELLKTIFKINMKTQLIEDIEKIKNMEENDDKIDNDIKIKMEVTD
ncbi:unnamed protein product [Cunninghamella echinulata]